MKGSQTYFVEPKKSDRKTYTVIFYLHKVHEQPNYSLVTNHNRAVVSMEGRLTGRDVRKRSG